MATCLISYHVGSQNHRFLGVLGVIHSLLLDRVECIPAENMMDCLHASESIVRLSTCTNVRGNIYWTEQYSVTPCRTDSIWA